MPDVSQTLLGVALVGVLLDDERFAVPGNGELLIVTPVIHLYMSPAPRPTEVSFTYKPDPLSPDLAALYQACLSRPRGRVELNGYTLHGLKMVDVILEDCRVREWHDCAWIDGKPYEVNFGGFTRLLPIIWDAVPDGDGKRDFRAVLYKAEAAP